MDDGLWETIARGVEEFADNGADRADGDDGTGLARAKAGAVVGAISTAVILWFMLVASAATLGKHHRPVATA